MAEAHHGRGSRSGGRPPPPPSSSLRDGRPPFRPAGVYRPAVGAGDARGYRDGKEADRGRERASSRERDSYRDRESERDRDRGRGRGDEGRDRGQRLDRRPPLGPASASPHARPAADEEPASKKSKNYSPIIWDDRPKAEKGDSKPLRVVRPPSIIAEAAAAVAAAAAARATPQPSLTDASPPQDEDLLDDPVEYVHTEQGAAELAARSPTDGAEQPHPQSPSDSRETGELRDEEEDKEIGPPGKAPGTEPADGDETPVNYGEQQEPADEGPATHSGDSYERRLNAQELADLDREQDASRPSSQAGEKEPESMSSLEQAVTPVQEEQEDLTSPKSQLNRAINMLQSCRSVDEFERLNRIDEGTYGVVYRARDKKSDEVVALKKVKMDKEREGFPMTALREVNILLSFHHPNIVNVKEVVVGKNLDSIFMVMEFMEHDLKALMEQMKHPFSQSEVKCLMKQLFEGIYFLHDNWVLHRDLKTSNLLLNNKGELKICDFGLARQYGSPLKPYTHVVVTLWYRAPELLLGKKEYSTAIDMWSLGCIMAELLCKEPLFTGKTEIDQIDKIFKLLGTPSDKIWPEFSSLPSVKKVSFTRQPHNLLRHKFPKASVVAGQPYLSDAGFDLLDRLLTYDPEKACRITADEALNHAWFTEPPFPKDKELMPTFPTCKGAPADKRRRMRSPDPLISQLRREELALKLEAGGGLFSNL
eukprot:jgi/Chlat1/8259/Chrsp78S07698